MPMASQCKEYQKTGKGGGERPETAKGWVGVEVKRKKAGKPPDKPASGRSPKTNNNGEENYDASASILPEQAWESPEKRSQDQKIVQNTSGVRPGSVTLPPSSTIAYAALHLFAQAASRHPKANSKKR